MTHERLNIFSCDQIASQLKHPSRVSQASQPREELLSIQLNKHCRKLKFHNNSKSTNNLEEKHIFKYYTKALVHVAISSWMGKSFPKKTRKHNIQLQKGNETYQNPNKPQTLIE